MKKLKIYNNAPITLGFMLICVIALLLSYLPGSNTTVLFFSTYRSSLLDPLMYIRLIGHVFGHSSWEHLISNMLILSITGPILEEKYGKKLIYVILITAIITGIIHNIFFPDTMLLGASGVCFAFLVLTSITGNQDGIPLTFIVVMVLWIGSEIIDAFTLQDNISQLTHIIGGLIGGLSGLYIKNNK